LQILLNLLNSKENLKNNKMYDHEKRIFLIEKFFELKNMTLVQRAFCTRYKNIKAPCRFTIIKMVQAFKSTGHYSRLTSQVREKRV